MSEWNVEQTWNITPSEKLVVENEEISIRGMSPSEIKQKIIEIARSKGWSKIRVFVNDNPVSPMDFEQKINELRSRNENITIRVEKLDIAG